MKRLVLHPTSTAQWHVLVNEAQAASDRWLDEALESYLVFLLMRFAARPTMAGSVVALDYLHSAAATGQLREAGLRDVGDHCLLYAGLFPSRAERRRVGPRYYVELGRSAYWQLSDLVETGDADLYAQLSRCFLALRDVLHAMRQDPRAEAVLGEKDETADSLERSVPSPHRAH